VIAWYLRRRFTVLFVTLLATLAVGPLREALGLESGPLDVLIAINLVAAAAGISDHPGRRRVLVVVSAAVVGTRFLPTALVPAAIESVADLTWVVIAALAALAGVRYALRATTVDGEHVAAALSAYLLAGLVFAVLYLLVDHARPGSLVDPAGGALTLESAIYFSYVTLATLGYGDIVPRSEMARGLAVFEAVGAQLYLTVTIAMLVGLYAQGAGRHRSNREDRS